MPEAETANEQIELAGSLEGARKLIADGMYEQADKILSGLWLKDPSNLEIISSYVSLMKECGYTEQATKIKTLMQLMSGLEPEPEPESEPESKVNPTTSKADERQVVTDATVEEDEYSQLDEEKKLPYAYFEAAFSLADARHFELAIMLLKQCDQMQPADPNVKYELGFALMSLNRVTEAIDQFESALKITADFDTTLNLSVCYVLSRNAARAKELTAKLEKLAQDADEVREVNHRKMVLKRLTNLASKKSLTAQDWLYVLYGSILLSPKTQSGKREEQKSIAEILLLLKGLLEALSLEVEVIEYYNTQSRPLAKIFSELMELPMDSYKGPNRPENCLLIMDWATDLIGPHEAFIDNSEKRIIFAYALTNTEPLPVVPDVVGCLADEPTMPWNQKTKDETIQTVCQKILETARNLETDPEVLTSTHDLANYYEAKKGELIIKNTRVFAERPEYSAEIQSS